MERHRDEERYTRNREPLNEARKPHRPHGGTRKNGNGQAKQKPPTTQYDRKKGKTQKRWSERHPPTESRRKPHRNTKGKRENPGYRNKDKNQGTAYKSLMKTTGVKDEGAKRNIRDSSQWVTPSLRENLRSEREGPSSTQGQRR